MKITRTCDNCNKILRKADMYETIEKPSRKLCSICFYEWCGIANPRGNK